MKIKTIEIIGKRWFQKLYGNTYHTVRYCINGGDWDSLPMKYGSGEQYMETAESHMKEQGIIPNDAPCLWIFCRDNKINLFTTAHDVLKREL